MVTKRCRLSCLTNSALVYEPICRGRWVVAEYRYTQEPKKTNRRGIRRTLTVHELLEYKKERPSKFCDSTGAKIRRKSGADRVFLTFYSLISFIFSPPNVDILSPLPVRSFNFRQDFTHIYKHREMIYINEKEAILPPPPPLHPRPRSIHLKKAKNISYQSLIFKCKFICKPI